ncbi:DUF2147 domain-containing protein [Bradyrhizobium sp. STM 3557]|uniref:DUF2147 domain-containing protein n=1 Tax=Bradyrhizobium sp. STM 3557 TaxID=578920 RepID=UPI00388D4978
MKTLFAVAVLLLASSAARAQYQFEYNGQTIRIDPDRGTVSIPGVYDNTGERAKRPRRMQDTARKQPPREARSDNRQKLPLQAAPADAAAAPPAPSTALPSAGAAAAAAPVAPDQPSTPPAPQRLQESAPASSVAPLSAARPAPAQAATAPALPAPPSPDVAPPARDPNSPVGIWLTEEKEGKIRIEPCGSNLCGYAVDAKSNENREQILINMRPGQNKVWSGRIFDPDSGSTYDSTIALKGSDSLRVQGCALGGMFCGGQTWTRVN